MGHVVGGLGIAHTPSMGHAFDGRKDVAFPERWQRWFDGLAPVKRWIAELKPSHMVIIYNDHLNYFDFSVYPTFAIGMAAKFPQADEGWGKRPLPDLDGDPGFSAPVATSLVSDGFDLTFCQELEIDHGIYSWLPCVVEPPWPMPILPIAVNMVMQPVPTAGRLHALGAALRSAIADSPVDARVLVVATGGMSHQIHGLRFGMTNQTFDQYFLDKITHDWRELIAVPMTKVMQVAGTEAGELAMWYAMRGALSENVRQAYSFYILPEITGCGVVAIEERDGA
ncbi:MAG: protocatechuate 3,4-dioxygenase [Alphaproteobacteria bacterium]|nr:protocatechuate 3,4-dioxygenase [Alphaproteobacteria bacterium]